MSSHDDKINSHTTLENEIAKAKALLDEVYGFVRLAENAVQNQDFTKAGFYAFLAGKEAERAAFVLHTCEQLDNECTRE